MEAEGGVIFYLDETEEHGLVASMWPLFGFYNWNNALSVSENLSSLGYDDWYLPSIEELELLFLNYVPGTWPPPWDIDFNTKYWSSTQQNDSVASSISLGSGVTDENILEELQVRPIRSF